jgi:hypothetical protein
MMYNNQEMIDAAGKGLALAADRSVQATGNIAT